MAAARAVTAILGRRLRPPSPGRRAYTCAITRGIPSTFDRALASESASSSSSSEEGDASSPIISVPNARREHAAYVSCLREVIPRVIHLPPDEAHPDCVFVEDAAVVVGRIAVSTRMGAPSRMGEAGAVAATLRDLGLTVLEMPPSAAAASASAADGEEDGEEGATCDGGDVLLLPPQSSPGKGTGTAAGRGPIRYMFVGLSERTNLAGANFLADAFADVGVEVVPVPLPAAAAAPSSSSSSSSSSSPLHLKSIVTHVDARTLLVPRGKLGDDVLRAMDAEARGYSAVRLPDPAACNVVAANGTVLAPESDCPETRTIFEGAMAERNLAVRYLGNGECAKCDGAMTCRSILIDL